MKKTDWRKRIRRLQFNLRRSPITFVGDAGKPYRVALMALLGIGLALIVVFAGREEPQLMSSAEVLSLKDRGVLRVGVRYDMPGLCGPDGGLEHDLARLLAQRVLPEADASSCVELVEINSVTLGPKLDDGGADVVIAMAASPMASKYSYSTPYYSDPCLLVALSGTPNFVLENMEIGVVQSNSIRKSPESLLFESYVASHPNLGLKEKAYASYPDMLEGLERGEVRAVLLTELYSQRYAKDYPITATAFSIGMVDYAVCAASDSPVLAQVGTLLINDLLEDGSLPQMYADHGLDPSRLPARQQEQ